MLAVKGLYNDGQIVLKRKIPIKTAEVIVIFPDSEDASEKMTLSADNKRNLFEEFSGSVDRMIDVKAEKMEALDRRYESMERYVRD